MYAIVGQQLRIVPERLAISAPEQAERPAWQWLPRVPLALTDMNYTFGSIMLLQCQQKFAGQLALFLAECGRVPLGAFHVVNGNECGFATHGQPDIVGLQFLVHALAECIDCLPLIRRVGLGDAWVFMDARNAVLVKERHFTDACRARYWCSADRVRGTGQWYVAFRGQQS